MWNISLREAPPWRADNDRWGASAILSSVQRQLPAENGPSSSGTSACGVGDVFSCRNANFLCKLACFSDLNESETQRACCCPRWIFCVCQKGAWLKIYHSQLRAEQQWPHTSAARLRAVIFSPNYALPITECSLTKASSLGNNFYIRLSEILGQRGLFWPLKSALVTWPYDGPSARNRAFNAALTRRPCSPLTHFVFLSGRIWGGLAAEKRHVCGGHFQPEAVVVDWRRWGHVVRPEQRRTAPDFGACHWVYKI